MKPEATRTVVRNIDALCTYTPPLGEWVQPVGNKSSEKPIQFNNSARELNKTTRAKWLPGQDASFFFFVYLQQGAAYLTTTRPPDE